MELHQFRHSAFCEKVRLILAAKGLENIDGIGSGHEHFYGIDRGPVQPGRRCLEKMSQT